MSPCTTSTSRPASAAGSALARTIARTRSPRARSSRQRLLPTWQLAPVTSVGCMRPPLPRPTRRRQGVQLISSLLSRPPRGRGSGGGSLEFWHPGCPLEQLEECDLGAANGPSDSCCTSSCMFRPAGEACRPAAGACDAVESCTGLADVCPPDLKSIGVCRPAPDVCDVAELCDGVSNDCPPDDFAPSIVVCRPSAGACDPAESCTGAGPSCPADTKSTAICRPAADACDVAESCDGVSNDCPPDDVAPSGTVCRPSAGACDAAES